MHSGLCRGIAPPPRTGRFRTSRTFRTCVLPYSRTWHLRAFRPPATGHLPPGKTSASLFSRPLVRLQPVIPRYSPFLCRQSASDASIRPYLGCVSIETGLRPISGLPPTASQTQFGRLDLRRASSPGPVAQALPGRQRPPYPVRTRAEHQRPEGRSTLPRSVCPAVPPADPVDDRSRPPTDPRAR